MITYAICYSKAMAKHAGGRPTKLTPELMEKANKYLADTDALGPVALLPTVERLCLILDISRDTYYSWTDSSPEFSDIARRLSLSSADKLQQNSLAGRWNPLISKLLLSKHGYVEKSAVENSGEQKVTVEIKKYSKDA